MFVRTVWQALPWSRSWRSILSSEDENKMRQNTFKGHITRNNDKKTTHNLSRINQWECLLRIKFDTVNTIRSLFELVGSCVWLARFKRRKCVWSIGAFLGTKLGFLCALSVNIYWEKATRPLLRIEESMKGRQHRWIVFKKNLGRNWVRSRAEAYSALEHRGQRLNLSNSPD